MKFADQLRGSVTKAIEDMGPEVGRLYDKFKQEAAVRASNGFDCLLYEHDRFCDEEDPFGELFCKLAEADGFSINWEPTSGEVYCSWSKDEEVE